MDRMLAGRSRHGEGTTDWTLSYTEHDKFSWLTRREANLTLQDAYLDVGINHGRLIALHTERELPLRHSFFKLMG